MTLFTKIAKIKFHKETPQKEKIFIIYNTACFGDVLLCNSLCQNIKNIFPEAKVVFVANENFKDVAINQFNVDDVISFDKKGRHKGLFGLIKFISTFKYKRAFASFITYNNFRNKLIAFFTGSKNIITPQKKHKNIPTQERHNHLLKFITNQNIKNYPIKYIVPASAKQACKNLLPENSDYIVICTLSKNPEKDMPIKIAEDLIKKINNTKNSVVYVGTGNQAFQYAENLQSHGCKFINLTNKTTIPELACILENAKCLISIDTGTMHLGCAVGVPTIAVFYEHGTSHIWAPKSEIYNSVILDKDTGADNIFHNLTEILKSENMR